MLDWLRDIFSTSDRTLQKWFSDPHTYEKRILKLRERAVPGLISMLDDERNGWQAASLLGNLGIREASIIDALRRRITGQSGVSESSARALARLDDVEFLMTLLGDEAKQRHAVHGIVSLLKSSSVAALDYRPAELLLNSGSEGIVSMVCEELAPGASFIDIKPPDIDEAIRGLKSEHVVIRQHAVCVLGDPGLGNAAAEVVLPALAERLEDEVPNVRRLALLSLSYWKGLAKPFHEEMRKRQQDEDADVRSTATYVFE
jgi:HEAT repeat protein